MTPPVLFAMAQAPGSSGGFSILILQVVAIGLVFYFLIIRPQGQARKKHEQLLAALKKGDEITTSGGLIGKVKDIKDDRVTVESGSATVVVERARIVRVGQTNAPAQAG
ncbi:MAG TPA: preprotein translocase subunit YajC [Gemmatimonadales bacterium]|nr:preprotein translocase subunit YajC [Gemmatimonadales bacterium]